MHFVLSMTVLFQPENVFELGGITNKVAWVAKFSVTNWLTF